MSSLAIGLISAGCIFGGALLGLLLHGLLPEHHLRDTSKDTVKVVAGMIATLAALVLGLLVGSAKSSFDATSTAITQSGAKIILLPRSGAQRLEYEKRGWPNMIIPREALDGANLIAATDLVVSAGGTMNREAAALGVPAVSIYAGEWAAIDEELVREGRLQRISSREEIESLRIVKKSGLNPRRASHVYNEIVGLVLGG